MDKLGVKVDEVLSHLIEQGEALRAENVQKSARVDQLVRTVSDLESEVAKLTQHLYEQQRDFIWMRLNFESVRAQQTALIELLETKLNFSRNINNKLCELISRLSQKYQEDNERLSKQVEDLREEATSRDHYKENMEMLLSESLQQATSEVSNLLERYATDVHDARREKNYFEAMLRKFKGDDRDSRKEFSRLCGELIEKQKQFIESQPPC